MTIHMPASDLACMIEQIKPAHPAVQHVSRLGEIFIPLAVISWPGVCMPPLCSMCEAKLLLYSPGYAWSAINKWIGNSCSIREQVELHAPLHVANTDMITKAVHWESISLSLFPPGIPFLTELHINSIKLHDDPQLLSKRQQRNFAPIIKYHWYCLGNLFTIHVYHVNWVYFVI